KLTHRIGLRGYDTGMEGDARRQLPSVDALLEAARSNGGAPLLETVGHGGAVEVARRLLAEERERLAAGAPIATLDQLVTRLESALADRSKPSLQRVINATGVILQTNLVRAPLSDAAVAAMEAAA